MGSVGTTPTDLEDSSGTPGTKNARNASPSPGPPEQFDMLAAATESGESIDRYGGCRDNEQCWDAKARTGFGTC